MWRFSHSLERVRPGLRLTLGLGRIALFWGLVTADAYAQFNARGRSPPPSATPKTATQKPAQRESPGEGPERDEALIKRYEKLILTELGEDVPLTRLSELVRKRDGNLNALLQKLEADASSGANKYAALVAWGGILWKDGQLEAAAKRLEDAATLSPNRPEAWQLLGTLQQTLGKKKEAQQSFTSALPHLQGPERSMMVRTLRDLCLDIGDHDCAKRHHRTLTQESHGNLFLQGELGRELLKRGHTDRAIEELDRVAKEATGDARALSPALRDLGEAQLEGGKVKEAIASLKKASQLAAASPGLRIAIDTLRAEAHRKDGSLSVLLEELETSTNSAARLGLLGRLHEEQGSTEQAVSTYEKALRLDPNNLDLRLRLVRLYEVTGDIDSAANEYGRLVRASPRDIQLTLRYAEMLLAQGKRDRAVAEFDRIDRLTASDPEAGLLLLDFAERLEETERKKRIMARLSQLGSRDTQFLVELGSRYYQSGATDTAYRTWKRILDVSPDRARGHLTYGEVLIDHEKAIEGVAELRKAADLAPQDMRVKKALALGLERAASQAPPATKHDLEQQALKTWLDLLRKAPDSSDPTMSQTQGLARRHVVRIWKRTGKLAEVLAPLSKDLHKTPPDLESGRLLAEAYLAARSERQAIATLKQVLKHAPGDLPSLLLLESVYTKTGDYEETIGILHKLVEADPRRAREYYDRMARAAAQKNDHKTALRYAELAVQKSPTDPAAQASLGDLYSSQGRLKEAEAAYRRALAQDDRLHLVSLKLAEILAKTDRATEALDVLLHVARSARDLDAVGLSARRAIALSIPLKKEREVEDVLRPLAISYPEQALYRTLLLEVLSSQMYSLRLASEHGPLSDRETARAALKALSDRSTGPLLAALSSRNAGEQQIAISLLSHSGTRTAGSGLLAFAEGSAPEEQRLLAILALGNLDNGEFDERLQSLISPLGTPRRGRIARAAAWALSRGGNPESATVLLGLLADSDLELRSYAALGLGDLPPSAATRVKVVQELSSIVEGVEYGGITRSAAALALGKLAAGPALKEQERLAIEQTLLGAYAANSVLLQQSALSSLARVSTGPFVKERVAQGLLSADSDLREAATFAAILLVLGNKAPAVGSLLPARLTPAEMDAEERVAAALRASNADVSSQSRHAALVLLEPDLIDHAKVGLRSSAQEASAILEQIRLEGPHVLFGELLRAEDTQQDSPILTQALAASGRIRAALKDEIVSLASGPHPELAEHALRTLRTDDGSAALHVIERQLRNPAADIQAAALDAVMNSADSEAFLVLTEYLKSEVSWGRRRRVASALGELIESSQSPGVVEQARSALASLRRDPSELVRAEVSAILNRPSNDPVSND